jgi:hypothetical protein
MNKYAAEKIAQDYYAIGAQLALTKQANFAKAFHKAQNALLGTLGGVATAGLATPTIKQLLADAGTLGTADQIINALPEALGIGAGLGVGTGIYKGLGKLDKKLKLY